MPSAATGVSPGVPSGGAGEEDVLSRAIRAPAQINVDKSGGADYYLKFRFSILMKQVKYKNTKS
jgi:hypothetical protein